MNQAETPISPDAMFLAVQWARRFHPWLWNRAANTWTAKGNNHPLLQCNIAQLQFALDQGWTRDKILRALKEAKEAKRKCTHVYETLVDVKDLPTDKDDLLRRYPDSRHNALFQRGGVPVEHFTVDELIAYTELFQKNEYVRMAFRAIVCIYGLDTTLYALDALRASEWKPRSPWGLKAFLDEAKARRESQVDQRLSYHIEAQTLKDAAAHDAVPDIDWLA